MHPLADKNLASCLQTHMNIDSLIAMSSCCRDPYRAFRPQLAARLVTLFQLTLESPADLSQVMPAVEQKFMIRMQEVDAQMQKLYIAFREAIHQEHARRHFFPLPSELELDKDVLTRRNAYCKWIGSNLNSNAADQFYQAIKNIENPRLLHFLLTAARRPSVTGLSSQNSHRFTIKVLCRMVDLGQLQDNERLQCAVTTLRQNWNSFSESQQITTLLYRSGQDPSRQLFDQFVTDPQFIWADDTVRKAVALLQQPSSADPGFQNTTIACLLHSLASLETSPIEVRDATLSMLQRFLDCTTEAQALELLKANFMREREADPLKRFLSGINDADCEKAYNEMKEQFCKFTLLQQVSMLFTMLNYLASLKTLAPTAYSQATNNINRFFSDPSLIWADASLQPASSYLFKTINWENHPVCPNGLEMISCDDQLGLAKIGTINNLLYNILICSTDKIQLISKYLLEIPTVSSQSQLHTLEVQFAKAMVENI